MDINKGIDKLRSFLSKVRQVWANGCIGKTVVLSGIWMLCGICSIAMWIATPQSVKDEQNATATARVENREATEEVRGTQSAAEETAEVATEEFEAAQSQADSTATADAVAAMTALAPTEDPDRASIEEYWKFVGSNLGSIGEVSTAAGEQLGLAGEDPTVILDEDWKLRMAVGLGFMGGSAEAIINRDDVPESATVLQAALEEMARHLSASVTSFANGIDNLDPSEFEAGGREMSAANSVLREKVMPEVARFKALHGLEDVD